MMFVPFGGDDSQLLVAAAAALTQARAGGALESDALAYGEHEQYHQFSIKVLIRQLELG
jgi:hypothetical protein